MTNFYTALSALKAKMEAAEVKVYLDLNADLDIDELVDVVNVPQHVNSSSSREKKVSDPLKPRKAYPPRTFKSGLKTAKLSLDREMMAHFREGENVRIDVVDGALTLKPTPTSTKPGHFVVAAVSTEQSGRGTVRLNQYVLNRLVHKFGMDAVRDLVKPGQRVKVAPGKYRTFVRNDESAMSFTVTKP